MMRLLAIFLAVAHALPFWKSKERVYERIRDGEVIVSVTSQPEDPGRRLQVGGGAWVNAPCEFTFKHAQNFEQMARETGYFSVSKYNPETHIMDLTIEAFAVKGSFQVEIKAQPEPRRLSFRMVSGAMNGFFWHLDLLDVERAKCEVGISGEYRYQSFPIPRLFLEFGMEVIFQRMAQRLRSFVENERRGVDKPKSPMKESPRSAGDGT